MSAADRAREEVERIAQDMRKGAANFTKKVESMADHRSINHSYGHYVTQLRIGLLVALAMQALTLFMEADRLGLMAFLPAFVLIIVNVFLSGKRWYYMIDGRYDAQQLVSVTDNYLRLQYAIALFGSLVLALTAHCASPLMPSGLSSLLYHLSDYAAIATSLGCVGLECVEGLRSKYS